MEDQGWTFEVRLENPQIVPENLSISDLASILGTFHSLLDTSTTNGQLLFSLVDVRRGSAGLHIRCNDRVRGKERLRKAGSLINGQKASPSGRNVAAGLWSLADRLSTSIHVIDLDDRSTFFKIDPNEVVEQAPSVHVEGSTTIYGYVERVGGAEPKVVLNLLSGETLRIRVDKDLARKFASYLYQWVSVDGEATWDANDWEIVDFRASEVFSYESGSIQEAVRELARISGPEAWTDKFGGVDRASRSR